MLPETVLGLPLHPLVVHAVVVLLPLSALGAVAVALVPRWQRPYGALVAAGAVAGAASAYVAREAGLALAASLQLGGPVAEKVDQHSRYGLYVVLSSVPFALLAVGAVLAALRGASPGTQRLVAALSAVAGLVVAVLVVLAGHSGSQAVWDPTG